VIRGRVGAMIAGAIISIAGFANLVTAQESTPGCDDDSLSFDDCITDEILTWTRHADLGTVIASSPPAGPIGPLVEPGGSSSGGNGGGSGSGGSGSGGSGSSSGDSSSSGSGSSGSSSGGSGSSGSSSGSSGSSGGSGGSSGGHGSSSGGHGSSGGGGCHW
jgi:hypothetical protein